LSTIHNLIQATAQADPDIAAVSTQQIGRTKKMLTYLIVSGWCLLLLLHIVCKLWQKALQIHSTADKFDKARDVAARGQQATNDSECNSSGTGWLESSRPKFCHVW
jgi:hypothetical protein